MEMRAWDQAELILSEAVRVDPNDAEALYLLGETYYHLGRGAEMKRDFDRSLHITRHYRRQIDYYSKRCSIEQYNKAQQALQAVPPDYEGAVQLFQQVLLLKSDDFEVERSLAFCYEAIDSVKTATAILERLASDKPDDLLSLDHLAGCYYKLQLYEKCIRTCDLILERSPQYQNGLLLRALALDGSGDAAAAVGAYERVLSVLGDRTDIAYNLGLCYFALGRYRDAINTFGGEPQSDASRADIPYLVGECYFNLYEYDRAATHFEKARRVDPEYGDSRNFLKVIDEILERSN